MKKVFNSLFVIIAAMVTFAGCAKQEIDAPATPETKTVQFFAESIETKTAFDKPDGTTYPTLWTTNDEKVHLSMNLTSSSAYDITPSDDFKTARFEAAITDDETGSYTFYSVSPASANILFNSSNKSYNLEIPTTQNPSPTSVDEKAQILAAKSIVYNQFPNSVELNYSHLTAYGKLSFKNLSLGEGVEVNSVALTASENFAYRYYFYPETGELKENGSTKTITINTSATSDIWFACAPVNLSGKTMDIVINTNKGTYSKTITFTNGGNFEAGKIAKFAVNMEGISMVSPEVYVIVENTSDLTEGSKVIFVGGNYAMSTNQKSNNRAAASVTLSDDKSTVSTPGADVQIFTVETGTKTGTVAFNTGSGYIYAASSSSNHLKTQTNLDDNASWSVSISEGLATILAQGTNTRNTMYYNPNNDSPLFSCYAACPTDGTLVSIYKLEGSGTIKENYLEVTPSLINVKYDDTTTSFTVNSDLEWTASSENATVSTKGNTVNVSFDANEDAGEKTYTVTVSAAGVDPQVVTITQEGKPAEGGEVESGWVSTAFANLKNGDQIVIVSINGTTSIYAMSNDNGTGSAPAAVAVECSNNKLSSEPEARLVWTVEISESNYIFHPGSDNNNWLYCTSSNNGVRVGTNTNKAFVMDASGYLKHVATSRYLGVYNNQDWRCYTNTTGNTAGQTFKFFVKKGDGGVVTPDPTPNPEEPDTPDTPGGTKYYEKVTIATPGAGTYLYVLDKGYVFTGDVSDNSWGKSVAVTIADNKIEATETVNGYAITLEEGISGQYAVKLPNGQYLVTSTQKPSSSVTASYMTYDPTEGLRSVSNSEYYFHGNTNSNSFRWYKLTSNQNAGQLYKLN